MKFILYFFRIFFLLFKFILKLIYILFFHNLNYDLHFLAHRYYFIFLSIFCRPQNKQFFLFKFPFILFLFLEVFKVAEEELVIGQLINPPSLLPSLTTFHHIISGQLLILVNQFLWLLWPCLIIKLLFTGFWRGGYH